MSDSVTELCLHQREHWQAGQRLPVETYVERHPDLRADPEGLLDLIYNEIVLRERSGDRPILADYVHRFPHLATKLRHQFAIHRAIEDAALDNTKLAEEGELDDAAKNAPPEIPGYEILGELGRGGMGVVYKARHLRLKRLVALKMFQPGRRPSERELGRFRQEADAIARLQHPNIVQIYDVGQYNGMPYLALEFAENGTLADTLQQLPLTPHAAAELIETLARAISHAHQERVLHRDLKPANILFSRDGTAKITDFGLAKIMEHDEEGESERDATRTGEPLGTPRYMAPEQAAAEPDRIGPATDVYALGTILYECLIGQVPFVSASAIETLLRIQRDEPHPPRRLQASIPRDLETICLHCLQKEPSRRYATALDLAEDLQRFRCGEPIRARRTPTWERIAKWCVRRPLQATLLSAGVLAVVAGLLFLIARDQHQSRTRHEVDALVKEGQEALKQQDLQLAQMKFETALRSVLAEPALRDRELYVRGWRDHGIQAAEKQRWKQRRPPPRFDERRDDALILVALLDPANKSSLQAGREALHDALEFSVEPREKEQLVLIDVDLLLRQGAIADALALLDATPGISSRLWHSRRADCLAALNRPDEADAERRTAEQCAPRSALEAFMSGVHRCHQHDWSGAANEFEKVLEVEPDHFAARLIQSVCFLHLKRPSEAKIALTACIAQRPTMVWGHLVRAEAYLQLQNHVSAARDLQQALELKPGERTQPHVNITLDSFTQTIASLPAERRAAIGNATIPTAHGPQRLGDLPMFQAILAP